MHNRREREVPPLEAGDGKPRGRIETIRGAIGDEGQKFRVIVDGRVEVFGCR